MLGDARRLLICQGDAREQLPPWAMARRRCPDALLADAVDHPARPVA